MLCVCLQELIDPSVRLVLLSNQYSIEKLCTHEFLAHLLRIDAHLRRPLALPHACCSLEVPNGCHVSVAIGSLDLVHKFQELERAALFFDDFLGLVTYRRIMPSFFHSCFFDESPVPSAMRPPSDIDL